MIVVDADGEVRRVRARHERAPVPLWKRALRRRQRVRRGRLGPRDAEGSGLRVFVEWIRRTLHMEPLYAEGRQ